MSKKFLIGAILAGLFGAAAWLGWRWYTTPAPPEVALPGAGPEVVAVVEAARQEVARAPRSGEAWGKLGMVLAAHGQRLPAGECFRYAARFDPADPRWPYLHALQMLATSPHDSIDWLRRSLPLAASPELRAVILFRLALLLIENGQLDDAELRLQALGQIDEPDGARSHFGMGLLAIYRDDPAAAREQLSPFADHPAFRKRVCGLLASLADGDEPQALYYRRQADRLPPDAGWPDPFDAEVQRFKVDRVSRITPVFDLEKQGRYAEALALLRQLHAERPDAEVCYLLGVHLYKAREFAESAAMLRAAIRYDERNVKSRLFLGEALLRLGEQRLQEPGGKEAARALFLEAVAAEDQALAFQNGLGYAHLTRGQALKHLGRTAESLQALRQALSCQLESSDMHLALGEALAEAGQFREAFEHLEAAVRLAVANDARPQEALEKWRARAKSAP